MSLPRRAPELVTRPKIALYLFERGMDYAAAAKELGRSREWVRLVCLPFDDTRRRTPDTQDMRKIFEWSGGDLTPADFYPEEMRPNTGAAPQVTAAAS